VVGGILTRTEATTTIAIAIANGNAEIVGNAWRRERHRVF
jgi:hypothetical protein